MRFSLAASTTKPAAIVLCLLPLAVAASDDGYAFYDRNGHGLVQHLLEAISPAFDDHWSNSTSTHRLLSSITTADGMNYATYLPVGRSFEDYGLASDFQFGRSYDLPRSSSQGLLNRLINLFLPTINKGLQSRITDPMDIGYNHSFGIPQIELPGGFCNAHVGFDMAMGSLTGMKAFHIDNLQLIPGTASIRPGWSDNGFCLQTMFSALFEIAVSAGDAQLVVPDMMGGVNAGVCSYNVSESVTGGVRTYKPTLFGAVNISGSLLGVLLNLTLVDVLSTVQVGFQKIEGYLDDVPPSINAAVANITSELSVLAKDKIVQSVMERELVQTVTPEFNMRASEIFQEQEMEFSVADALYYNGMFAMNALNLGLGSVSQKAINFLKSIQFGVSTTPSTAENPWGDATLAQSEEERKWAGESGKK